MKNEAIDLRKSFLQMRDRYSKNFAIAAISSIAIAAAFSLAKMQFGSVGFVTLGTGVLSGAAALYHYQKRKEEIKDFGLEDTPDTRHVHLIERIIRRVAVTKT